VLYANGGHKKNTQVGNGDNQKDDQRRHERDFNQRLPAGVFLSVNESSRNCLHAYGRFYGSTGVHFPGNIAGFHDRPRSGDLISSRNRVISI